MTRRTDGASRSIPCRHTLTHLAPPRRRLRLKGTLHGRFDPADASSAYAGRASSRSARAAQDASDSGDDEDSSDDDDDMKGGEGGSGRNAAQEESDEGDETDESGGDDDAEAQEQEQEQETDGEHAPRLLSAGPGARRRAGSTPPSPDDATKGTHIGTQKRLWDSLLQLRMRLQPAMEAARQLPRADAQAALRSGAGVQVIPTESHLLDRISPIFSPFFPRFLRVFTVSPRRFQRAASRNPGPRNSGKGAQTPFC